MTVTWLHIFLQAKTNPAVTMNGDSISIPIRDYETLMNTSIIQVNHSIIKQLQSLLIAKDEDLKRYREKYEQCNTVLQRTQRQLDNCLQYEQQQFASAPHMDHRPMTVSQTVTLVREPESPRVAETGELGLAPRSVGVAEPAAPQEDGEPVRFVQSLPIRQTENSDRPEVHLRSLPATLTSPGASTVLLQKLIHENIQLKSKLKSSSSRSRVSAVSLRPQRSSPFSWLAVSMWMNDPDLCRYLHNLLSAIWDMVAGLPRALTLARCGDSHFGLVVCRAPRT